MRCDEGDADGNRGESNMRRNGCGRADALPCAGKGTDERGTPVGRAEERQSARKDGSSADGDDGNARSGRSAVHAPVGRPKLTHTDSGIGRVARLTRHEDLKNMINDGMPVFGTCAGMIILADRIENEEKTHIGTMDITVRRNAYGRQLGSFYAEEDFDNVGKVPMTFIRAPYITKCGPKARAIATCKGNIVAAVQDNQMVTSFHPELNDSLLVHKYFVEEICK